MSGVDDTPLVLRPGVRLAPITELIAAEAMRGVPDITERHFAIVEAAARGPLRVVGPDTARLLTLFQSPRTVSEALDEFSAHSGADPARTLIDAAPLIVRLLRSTLLVPADRAALLTTEPTLAAGRFLDIGVSVLECIHLTNDTEVYRARHHSGEIVALKILRPPPDSAALAAFECELRALGGMDNVVNAPLLDAGTWKDRPYLLLGWIPGLPIDMVAGLVRAPHADYVARAHRLACGVLEAYEYLHAKGVVQGDVHPRNVIVGPDAGISVLDFGNSAPLRAVDGWRAQSWSIGVPEFAAPELLRHGTRAPGPRPTALSEQYSVAVLVDLVITGVPLRRPSVVAADVLSSVADQPVLSFQERGSRPWPELEQVLQRALDADPGRRFGSIGDFADEVRSAGARLPGHRPRRPSTRAAAADVAQKALLGSIVRDVSRVLPEFKSRWPTEDATVGRGASGIALALLDIARRKADHKLLALADLYATRAGRLLDQQTQPSGSLLYGATGVHLVQATVAAELHDMESLIDATKPVPQDCTHPVRPGGARSRGGRGPPGLCPAPRGADRFGDCTAVPPAAEVR